MSGAAPGIEMGLLGPSIGVFVKAASPGVPLQSQFAEPVVFGEPLVRQIYPSVSDTC